MPDMHNLRVYSRRYLVSNLGWRPCRFVVVTFYRVLPYSQKNSAAPPEPQLEPVPEPEAEPDPDPAEELEKKQSSKFYHAHRFV